MSYTQLKKIIYQSTTKYWQVLKRQAWKQSGHLGEAMTANRGLVVIFKVKQKQNEMWLMLLHEAGKKTSHSLTNNPVSLFIHWPSSPLLSRTLGYHCIQVPIKPQLGSSFFHFQTILSHRGSDNAPLPSPLAPLSITIRFTGMSVKYSNNPVVSILDTKTNEMLY